VPSGSKGRRLLPVTSSDGRASSSAMRNPLTWNIIAPQKRGTTTAACGACRKRKSKVSFLYISGLMRFSFANRSILLQCNAERPKCTLCVSKGTDCVYDTATTVETHTQALKRKYSELREHKTTYEQICELLQARPHAEANQIFKRIRNGADAESILRYIEEGDLLLQLSLVPETRYRYEFPFIQEMPTLLRRPDNPYLHSLVYEWTSKDSSSAQISVSPSDVGAVEYQSVYLKPYHAADIIDHRLNAVKPSSWTGVSDNDGLMRELIAAYFKYEHLWLTFFQKDYFLEDMAANRDRFCSSLLVNAILACGCVCSLHTLMQSLLNA
jgi:Fungal Zn(2)-Cys(6) binuclear cluster domain